jgi:hypothetical protein
LINDGVGVSWKSERMCEVSSKDKREMTADQRKGLGAPTNGLT